MGANRFGALISNKNDEGPLISNTNDMSKIKRLIMGNIDKVQMRFLVKY